MWLEGRDGRGGGRRGQGPTPQGLVGQVFGFYSKPWEAARGILCGGETSPWLWVGN